MDPRWQSTEDEQIVPVRTAATPAVAAKGVSRLPAAFVGISLILAVAAFSFGGLRQILGQLTDPTPDVTVHITQAGPEPASVTLAPGQVIRWINDTQIPHVLSSEELPTADGKPFSTPGIFPGDDAFYTVPAIAVDGTYGYISETDADFTGEVVISAAAAPVGGTSSAMSFPTQTSSTPSLPPLNTMSSMPAFPTSRASSIGGNPLGAGVIAVNPHVVGKKGSSSSKPGVTQHKPGKNAESGPALWLVAICGTASLFLVAKSAFKRI